MKTMTLIDMTYLDNGHFMISTVNAQRLNGGRLPDYGREALVEHDGRHWWLSRTVHNCRQVWTIREARGWRLVKGQAVLGGVR